MIALEDISIGEKSSRLSSAIFFLLCFVPALGAIIFGAVDETTWIIIITIWAAIILLWLAEAWRSGGLPINNSMLLLPLTAFAALGVVQLLPIASVASLNFSATRFFVIRLIVYIVFFAACLTFINSEKRMKKAVWFVVVFGAVLGFYGILQWLANPQGIYGLRGTPQAIPFGPFVNQHHFAAFMEMTGGVTLGVLFGAKRTRERTILLVLAVVIMGAAVGFTSSRGGLLGFVSVLAFVILVRLLTPNHTDESANDSSRATQKIAVAAGGLALIVVIFSVTLFLGGNEELLRGTGAVRADVDISSGRFHFWPVALKIFLDHPIVGAGFDAFGVAFTKYDTWNGVLRVEQAHNEYLQTLADSGVVGLVCVVVFIFVLFRKGIAMILSQTGFRKSAAVGALAGCFGIVVHSFFDFPLRTHSNTFFFLMLAALATVPVAAERKARRRRSSSEHSQ